VPQKLFDLRRHTLIDLARIKMSSPSSRDFSLSLKNLFGLLPQPSRYAYHPDLSQSIVDIDKVYKSLFDVVGLCEGIQKAIVYWDGGHFATFGRFDVVTDLGIAATGRDLVALDIFIGWLFGMDLVDRTAYRLGREAFGSGHPSLQKPAPVIDLKADNWATELDVEGKLMRN